MRAEDGLAAAAGCAAEMGPIRKIMPLPGGGMTRERIPQLLEAYGRDVIFLVGGGLHRQGPDLVANARDLLRAVEGQAMILTEKLVLLSEGRFHVHNLTEQVRAVIRRAACAKARPWFTTCTRPAA